MSEKTAQELALEHWRSGPLRETVWFKNTAGHNRWEVRLHWAPKESRILWIDFQVFEIAGVSEWQDVLRS